MQPGTKCLVSTGMRLTSFVLVAPLLLLAACDDSGSEPSDGSGSTGQVDGTGTTGATDPSTDADPPADDNSTGAADDDSTSGAGSSSTSADVPDDSTTSGAGEESSTGEPPTSGPGVLPGESGLEAFCRRYVECGGTYYADQQDCLDATVGYWGECTEVVGALDDFGACMADIACEDYNPDAYNPANTVCAEQWGEVGQAGPC